METTQAIQKRNGVDVQALHGMIKTLQENSALGKAKFRAVNRWKGQALNETTIGEFFAAGEERKHKTTLKYQCDEGEILLGKDAAGNPVEFVLHALAGCVTTTTVYYAAAHGITINSIETTLEGDIDIRGLLSVSEDVPVGYQNIRVTMKIDSDAGPDEKEMLENFYKKSPVFSTLMNGVKVDMTVESA